MINYFKTSVGRLRLLALLEGISLLVLVCIAVPVKHLLGNPSIVQLIGPLHGILFILYLLNSFKVGVEQQWKFRQTTWNLLVATFIPFGTFYVDYKILRPLQQMRQLEE